MKPYYDKDGITIYHGEALNVLAGMKDDSICSVITDPPYMISMASDHRKTNPWADMVNAAVWYSAWYGQVQRLLEDAGGFWTFCNWRTLPVVMKAAFDVGWGLTSLLVWDKRWIGPGGPRGLRPSYEFVGLLAGADFAIPDRSLPDIRACHWSSHKPTGHAAEKPVELLRWLLNISTLVDQLVLDPFMGSGTTLRAAKDTGRRAIGIEIEERYCEMAARRLAQKALPLGKGE